MIDHAYMMKLPLKNSRYIVQRTSGLVNTTACWETGTPNSVATEAPAHKMALGAFFNLSLRISSSACSFVFFIYSLLYNKPINVTFPDYVSKYC